MVAKLIRYKNKVTFDLFIVYGEYENDENWWEGEDIPIEKADSLNTYVCPWCVKKYGLYKEMDTTPEKIDEEIEFYRDCDPESLDFTCGVKGCYNGAADDTFNVGWENCEIVG